MVVNKWPKNTTRSIKGKVAQKRQMIKNRGPSSVQYLPQTDTLPVWAIITAIINQSYASSVTFGVFHINYIRWCNLLNYCTILFQYSLTSISGTSLSGTPSYVGQQCWLPWKILSFVWGIPSLSGTPRYVGHGTVAMVPWKLLVYKKTSLTGTQPKSKAKIITQVMYKSAFCNFIIQQRWLLLC